MDFELESGNGNVDGQTNGQKTEKTNRRNYTNFERNLAMMVIYLPVKVEFDWTNHFRVRVQKRKCGWTDGHINLIGGLVTRNPPKKNSMSLGLVV